jgi:hypothetical protein
VSLLQVMMPSGEGHESLCPFKQIHPCPQRNWTHMHERFSPPSPRLRHTYTYRFLCMRRWGTETDSDMEGVGEERGREREGGGERKRGTDREKESARARAPALRSASESGTRASSTGGGAGPAVVLLMLPTLKKPDVGEPFWVGRLSKRAPWMCPGVAPSACRGCSNSPLAIPVNASPARYAPVTHDRACTPNIGHYDRVVVRPLNQWVPFIGCFTLRWVNVTLQKSAHGSYSKIVCCFVTHIEGFFF